MQSGGSSGAAGDGEKISPGETVVVTSGEFESFAGTVINADESAGTLKVLISFMSAWRTVEVHRREVKRAN